MHVLSCSENASKVYYSSLSSDDSLTERAMLESGVLGSILSQLIFFKKCHFYSDVLIPKMLYKNCFEYFYVHMYIWSRWIYSTVWIRLSAHLYMLALNIKQSLLTYFMIPLSFFCVYKISWNYFYKLSSVMLKKRNKFPGLLKHVHEKKVIY